jgi:hypothetical protein
VIDHGKLNQIGHYVELFQKLNQRNSASKIEFQEPAQRRSVQVSAKRAVGKDSPNYWVAFPWPASDLLDGDFKAAIPEMITIGKVHHWDIGSACFLPSIEDE